MNHIPKIEAHLVHAKEKHRKFCDELIYPHRKREGDLQSARWALDAEEDSPRHVFAESILNCELAEVYEAIDNGRAEDAIEECYDAIAVLLRMVEFIESERNAENSK